MSQAPKTIRKIWKQAGIPSRKRPKKHVTKNNLRKLKKQFKLFELIIMEDTKDLLDIPEYCIQTRHLNCPKVQYTFRVESLPGQKHNTIFPGAHRMQSDVETSHNLIEAAFFEIEQFHSREDFFEKANSYQLFFNLKRPNSYKEHKTPLELTLEKKPDTNQHLFLVPPIDLDKLLRMKDVLITL